MDYSINWSPEATEDLESITEYISRDSEFYAKAVASNIISTADSLKKYPFTGRIVPELEDQTIREKFVYSYRLIYEIYNDNITIVAIIHGKRLFDNALDRTE